jgi:nucleoside-diphosphate-sugar epimerase
MKIMILGGHGFIGCHVSNILVNSGHDVSIIDNYDNYNSIPYWEYGAILQKRIAHSLCFSRDNDIVNPLNDVFAEFSPDVVIHLATYPNAYYVRDNPVKAAANMLTGTANVLDACVKNKVKRIVYASSSMVYGDFDNAYETTPCNPQTLYGNYKLQGERLIQLWKQNYGLEYTILRPISVYGTRDMIIRVISKMVASSIRNGEIQVNGNDLLDFTWVEDVAQYFALAATSLNASNEIFNCSRGNARLLIEAANIVSTKLNSKISISERDTLYPTRGTLNNSKIKSLLNYAPQIDIEQGIIQYIDWFLQQDCYKKHFNI